MAEFLKKYHIEAEALTPIFIGGGASADISKTDYYIDVRENKIYVIDMSKFLKLIIHNSSLMLIFESFIKDKTKTFNQFYNENSRLLINISDLKANYIKNVIDINDSDIRGGEGKQINGRRMDKSNDISGFVKDSEGHVYVPGSSIKGALRTIILKYYLENDKSKNCSNEMLNTIDRPKCNEYKKIENKYLNTLNRDQKIFSSAVNDKMSDLSISDSSIIKDELMLCEKIDMKPNGDEKPLGALHRECLKPNTKVEFDIVLKDGKFEINDLLNVINGNVKLYHNKYISKYNKNCFYDDLFIPIGGGVGFLSKTFTIEASDNDDIGLRNVSKILSKQFYKHKHELDYKKGFAPRLRKMAKYDDKLYDMGLLAIKKVVETKTGNEIPIPKVFN